MCKAQLEAPLPSPPPFRAIPESAQPPAPQAAGAAPGRGGREPNLCPSGGRRRPCPLALPRRGTTLPGAAALPARAAGGPAGSSVALCAPRLGFAAPETAAGRGKPAERPLSFRRRNAVSFPLPDSAPGIRLLIAFLKQTVPASLCPLLKSHLVNGLR